MLQYTISLASDLSILKGVAGLLGLAMCCRPVHDCNRLDVHVLSKGSMSTKSEWGFASPSLAVC